MATKNDVANEQNDELINIVSLDLGTRNLIVRVNGREVYKQAAAIVFDTENGEVFIGEAALVMKEKTPANKIFREPMSNGVISDNNALIALLNEIFTQIVDVKAEKIWQKSVALVAIPSKVFKLDRTVLKEILEGKKSAKIPIFSDKFPKRYLPVDSDLDHKEKLALNYSMNAEKVVIVPEVKLAAIGAGLSLWDASGVFVLDIGGGTSDCAILSSGEVIVQDSIPVAGNAIEAGIKSHFEKMHYITLSSEEAEKAKIGAGIWIDGDKDSEHRLTIHGKSTKTKKPEQIIISKQEVAKAVTEAFEPIVKLCEDIIDKAGAAFSKMIMDKGLVITGGGALLQNITTYLKIRLKMEHVVSANSPKECVIKGTQSYETHKQDLYTNGYIRPSK
ncbi:rod shape-determining protein [Spiroplasma endosymbiont of Virgichneumon dumeticola]|uniref:rod shape-determining protein n=1 Tax=Spiroplasma endosymbiont of Virgichneumon dumeticola TaxID=3139323 RepID=UPI0035C8AFF7